MVYKIIITIVCLLCAYHSYKLFIKSQFGKYPTHVSTLDLEKESSCKRHGYLLVLIFLLPLVNNWFPKWANEHCWNVFCAFILLIVALPTIVSNIQKEEDEKRRGDRYEDHYNTTDWKRSGTILNAFFLMYYNEDMKNIKYIFDLTC